MTTTRHTARAAAALLALAAGCAAPAPPAAPVHAAADPLLAAAADPDAPGHEAARERWSDLPWEIQCDRLRAGLRSPDPRVALFAARDLAPKHLSLEEIRLQAAILVRHPEEVLAPPGGGSGFRCDGAHSLGSPDLLPLLGTVVARGGIETSSAAFDDLHRIALPDHIPGLVRLLEPARDLAYDRILWMIRLLADNTDRHRDEVAASLLYARACWVAEAKGRAHPPLARFLGAAPTTAREFLERYHGLLEGVDPSDRAEQFPKAWFERWEREASPAPSSSRAEAFTAAEARERAAELAAGPAPIDGEAWDAVRADLFRIEVAAPDAVDELLRRWSEMLRGRAKEEVERLRARRANPPDPREEAEKWLKTLEGSDSVGVFAVVGRLGDRARPLLERYRRERHHGRYWEATAGLALAGDSAARAEVLACLREDRIALLDERTDLSLDGDREVLDHFLSRVGSNCCLWYHAWTSVQPWLPTLPGVNAVGDPDGRERLCRAWWERWKGRLRWSRIAEGWVPAAE